MDQVKTTGELGEKMPALVLGEVLEDPTRINGARFEARSDGLVSVTIAVRAKPGGWLDTVMQSAAVRGVQVLRSGVIWD